MAGRFDEWKSREPDREPSDKVCPICEELPCQCCPSCGAGPLDPCFQDCHCALCLRNKTEGAA